MAYKQDINNYKEEAKNTFAQHLLELEENMIKFNLQAARKKSFSELCLDYQTSALKLVEGKLKIDSEYLKQINVINLEKYKDLEPMKFQQISLKLSKNYNGIIKDLRHEYNRIVEESQKQLQFKLLEYSFDDSYTTINAESFFPKKINVLSIEFLIILILSGLIIEFVYYYN